MSYRKIQCLLQRSLVLTDISDVGSSFCVVFFFFSLPLFFFLKRDACIFPSTTPQLQVNDSNVITKYLGAYPDLEMKDRCVAHCLP